MSSIISFGLVFAACASSAFALGFDNLELSTLISGRNLLFALGVLILGAAGFMFMNCSCCNGSKCSIEKGGKKMKKHSDRAASVDSKRNSSTSSIRKSPRKSKISN